MKLRASGLSGTTDNFILYRSAHIAHVLSGHMFQLETLNLYETVWWSATYDFYFYHPRKVASLGDEISASNWEKRIQVIHNTIKWNR